MAATMLYLAGWDHALVGTATLSITDNSGGPFAVSITSGTFCHETLASITAVSGYIKFADTLTTALNASGTARTYTVTFTGAPSAPSYTIAVNAGTTTLTFGATSAGTLAKRILGFTATTGAAASHSSNARPYYTLGAAQGSTAAFSTLNTAGPSDDSGAREPDGVAVMSQADSGRTRLITRTAAPMLRDWTQRYEAKRSVYSVSAASTIPWTWEHFFQHVRQGNQPFVTEDTGANLVTVYYLTGDGASFIPTREVADFDDYWRIDIRAVRLGTI